jgi:hypothetical protein
MIPAKLYLEPFTEGDTWGGIPETTVLFNGAAPLVALASVSMRFVKETQASTEAAEITSANPAQISLTSAALWKFTVPPQQMSALTEGVWKWQLKVIDTLGVKSTIAFDKLTVLEHV